MTKRNLRSSQEIEMYANEASKTIQRALPAGVFIECIVVDQRSGNFAISGFVPRDVYEQAIVQSIGTGVVMIDKGNGLVKGATDYGGEGNVNG